MEELWKPIQGFNDWYEASNLGSIRSLDRLVQDVNGKRTRLFRSCKLRAGKSKAGYLTVVLCGKSHSVHRLVAHAWVLPVRGCSLVNHIDGDKSNNSITNLEWVTSSQNNAHAYATGLKESTNKYPCYVGDSVYESIHELARDRGLTIGCAHYRVSKSLYIDGLNYGLS